MSVLRMKERGEALVKKTHPIKSQGRLDARPKSASLSCKMFFAISSMMCFVGCVSSDGEKIQLQSLYERSQQLKDEAFQLQRQADEKMRYFTVTTNNITKLQDSTIKRYGELRLELVRLFASNKLEEVVSPVNPHLGFSSNKPPAPLVFNLAQDVSLEMIGIGSGSFVMGLPRPEDDDIFQHLRGHKVTLSDCFWIGKYEITREQYNAIFGKNRYDVTKTDEGKPPVSDLTWNEAMELTQRLNARFADKLPAGYRFTLPTEAQWEYACRAGTAESFNSGKMMPVDVFPPPDNSGRWRTVRLMKDEGDVCEDIAWYLKVSSLKLHPFQMSADHPTGVHAVGLKKPNAWGLHDMHGNIDEWCLDYLGKYSADNVIDPLGATVNSLRVTRGGSYVIGPGYCTSYHRWVKNIGNESVAGVRVVLSKEMNSRKDNEDKNVYGAQLRFVGDDKLNASIATARNNNFVKRGNLLVNLGKTNIKSGEEIKRNGRKLIAIGERQNEISRELQSLSKQIDELASRINEQETETAKWLEIGKTVLDISVEVLDISLAIAEAVDQQRNYVHSKPPPRRRQGTQGPPRRKQAPPKKTQETKPRRRPPKR